MQEFHRTLFSKIQKQLFTGKIIVLYGARQVGKTTLIRQLMKHQKHTFWSADQQKVQEIFSEVNPERIKQFMESNTDILVIDEAQMIEDIGIKLKVLHDTYPEIQIIATGSSSFELANKINEPLTGRTYTHLLYPLSYAEYEDNFGKLIAFSSLEKFLITGMYPEVLQSNNTIDAEEKIAAITNSYVYKDILAFEGIRKSEKLIQLMKLLAFQIGQEVSIHEIATKIGANRSLVEHYISILEQSFIIIRISPLSRNLRNEIGKKQKIYFIDLGLRNALIQGFQSLEYRYDIGHIWENWIILERIKYHAYKTGVQPSYYFWRTHTGDEIDFIEEKNGQFHAIECKWKRSAQKIPPTFTKHYTPYTWTCITQDSLITNLYLDLDKDHLNASSRQKETSQQ